MSIHTQHFDVCRHRHVHTKLTFSLGFVLAPGVILPPVVHVQSGSSRASARFQSCFFVWRSGKVCSTREKSKRGMLSGVRETHWCIIFLTILEHEKLFSISILLCAEKTCGKQSSLSSYYSFAAPLIALMYFCTLIYG